MKEAGRSKTMALVAATLIFLVPAAAVAAPMAATAVKARGSSEWISSADGKTYTVEVGSKFAEGDRLKTGAGAFLAIEFENGNRIQLSENTDLTIKVSRTEPSGGYSSIFGLALGKVRSLVSRFSPGSSKFEYQTKTAVAGVAGTDFITEVPEPNLTKVAVLPPGIEDQETPEDLGGAQVCGRPELQGKSRVYVQGSDDAKTTVYLTSCLMTQIGARQAPAQPFIIPDEMLFNMKKVFSPPPMMGGLMIDNIGKQVSQPLAKQNMNSLLHNLDTSLIHGGSAAMTNNSPANGGVVSGTIIITIK